jgi:Fur family ferric uptake transcriptional regulator
MPSRPAPSSSDLKNIGLKATLPRLKVLEIFQRSTAERGVRHMSAEDVYKALIAEHIDVGLATVYRVLTQFEQAGLLVRNHFEAGRSMFELNEGPHHDHLVCLTCGRVEDFVAADIENRQRRIAAERGFRLHDHALALYGECTKPDCEFRRKE